MKLISNAFTLIENKSGKEVVSKSMRDESQSILLNIETPYPPLQYATSSPAVQMIIELYYSFLDLF